VTTTGGYSVKLSQALELVCISGQRSGSPYMRYQMFFLPVSTSISTFTGVTYFLFCDNVNDYCPRVRIICVGKGPCNPSCKK
jgi:hypothetical protein